MLLLSAHSTVSPTPRRVLTQPPPLRSDLSRASTPILPELVNWMSTSHKCCYTIFTNTHSCASDIQTLQGGCPRMFLFLLSDQVKLVNWLAGNVWLREVCRARVFQLASFTSTIGVVRKSTDSQPHGHQVRKILDTHTCHLRNRNCLSTTRQCNVSLWLSELTGEPRLYVCHICVTRKSSFTLP